MAHCSDRFSFKVSVGDCRVNCFPCVVSITTIEVLIIRLIFNGNIFWSSTKTYNLICLTNEHQRNEQEDLTARTSIVELYFV